MVKDKCTAEEGCELGLVAQSPIQEPAFLSRYVQRNKSLFLPTER